MSLKRAKRKLRRFLDCHPEMTNPIKIRRDSKRNHGVNLPKIVLKTFSGDPLDWKSFNETLRQLCTVTKVSLTLKNLRTGKHT